jgi:hypothetical protein
MSTGQPFILQLSNKQGKRNTSAQILSLQNNDDSLLIRTGSWLARNFTPKTWLEIGQRLCSSVITENQSFSSPKGITNNTEKTILQSFKSN